jgi:predicted Zn-dependent protease
MTIYSEQDAKAILDKAIKASKADECTATLSGSNGGNIRYALNSVSTSGHVSDCDLAVEVAFGKRTGTATINSFDDASIEAVVRRAEELAKLAPENPEFMPAIDKQTYKASDTFAQTADIAPEYRASVAAACIEPCRKDKLTAAGFLEDGQEFSAIANSKGNFGYQKSTSMDFTCTVRTDDGKGSGWVARNLGDVSKFDAKSDIQTAIQKAKAPSTRRRSNPASTRSSWSRPRPRA